MKKTKQVVFIGILIAIIGIFLLASENTVDLQKNYDSSYAQAYNHKYENILENVFEENGITILPFIFENSNQTITKVYLLEQFEKVGLKVENGDELGDIIVTGDKIKTTDKTYTVLIYGDVNKDGEVDVMDADMVFLHYFNENVLKDIYKTAGNVYNDDGAVDVIDSQRIFEFYFGLQTKLVLNEPDASKKPDIPDKPEPVEDYVTGIKVTNSKTEYEYGESLDTSKIVVKEVMKSGKDGKTLTSSQYKVSGYDPYTDKEQTVKVTYTTKNTEDKTEKTFEATFKVTVKPYVPDPEAPVITLKGDKEITVKIGQYKELGATAVDFEGKEIDEKEIVIDASKIKDEQGVYKVIYRVKDKNTGKEAIAVRTVVVIDYVTGITAETTKTEYAYGEPLDKTKIEVKETMASKAEGALIALEKLEITGYEPNKIGEQEVTVTYKTNNTIDDKEASFTKTLKITVKSPEIKVNDGTKDITEITLYTEKPANNEMVKEETVDGNTNIYTLIPISLEGYENVPITFEDIALAKEEGKISVIDTKLNTSNTDSAILVKTYKKAQDGTFEEIDENSQDKTIDHIGIAINSTVISKPEELENIKLYYGNAKDASVTLEVNEKVKTIVAGIEDNTEVTLNQEIHIPVTFKNAKDEEIDIPARRVLAEATEMELKLLDKDEEEIDVAGDPEETVKFISVKASAVGENQDITITVDKDYTVRKVDKVVKINVTPPTIQVKDEAGNDITEVTLYTKKPLDNDMIKEYIENGNTNIYTLVPISYMGKEGSLPITLDDIVLVKEEGKISIIDTKLNTNITDSAILIKKYKKAENGTFSEVDENSQDKTIDYIGIAINSAITTKPEDLENIKIYYGNAKDASVTLTVNPKVEEIVLNNVQAVEITVNQERNIPIIFKNAKDEKIDIPARRVLVEATGMEVKLKNEKEIEIDVAGDPEEPVKYISIKASTIGDNQPITITVDKDDDIRECPQEELIKVIPPTIEATDKDGNKVTEITLCTQKQEGNEMVKEETIDGNTDIYTLVPIILRGNNGKIDITSAKIKSNVITEDDTDVINVIDNKVDESEDLVFSSLKITTYKKANNGTYTLLDENDDSIPVDAIGIAIDKSQGISTPEELKYVKFVYGTDKENGTSLTVNPKVEEIVLNNVQAVEITVNQERNIPIIFKNAKDEEIDIPARRVLVEATGMEVKLKNEKEIEIDVAGDPEEPVKYISIKASTIGDNQPITITVDKDDDIRECPQEELIKVIPPIIEATDKDGNKVTEITLYTQKQEGNEMVKEETIDGNTDIYTLVPIILRGNNGKIDITSAKIKSNVITEDDTDVINVIDNKVDESSLEYPVFSSLKITTYKKEEDGAYTLLDENDDSIPVDAIGIAIDKSQGITSPDELEYIKFVYGTDKENGKKLTITKQTQDNTGDAGSTDNTGNTEGTGTTDNP